MPDSKIVINDVHPHNGKNAPIWHQFYCPGCGCGHYFDDGWKWNGDREMPDVSPSISVRAGTDEHCHLFIKHGRLQYCSDSWHSYAGKSIPCVPWEET